MSVTLRGMSILTDLQERRLPVLFGMGRLFDFSGSFNRSLRRPASDAAISKALGDNFAHAGHHLWWATREYQTRQGQ